MFNNRKIVFALLGRTPIRPMACFNLRRVPFGRLNKKIQTQENIVKVVNHSTRRTIISLAAIAAFALTAFGQRSSGPTMVYGPERPNLPVAGNTNMYCAGYIQYGPVSTGNRIIGASGEADGYNFTQNGDVYINMGSNKGVNVGDTFSVVRPRGHVESRWTSKDVGFYVQEVGALQVIKVKSNHAIARIKTSCESFLLGDLVQPTENRVSPIAVPRPALDLYGDPSGKAMGRILMSRGGAETLSTNSVVYVDLGADASVSVGDHMTVFRPLGKGNPLQIPLKETVSERDEGYQSETYRGGKFSNQGSRKSGDHANGKMVTTYDAKSGRPALRKIVGEAVVLNVKERSATILITRNAQEIHTGDWVELQ